MKAGAAMIDLNPFPTLRTERLVLRQMTVEDAIELYQIYSDNKVVEHLDWNGFSAIEEAEALILAWNKSFENKLLIPWGIALKASNKLIGSIMLMPLRGTFEQSPLAPVTIGFELAVDYWNKGLMTEALHAATEFGKRQIGAHRIQAEVSPDNKASLVILQRAGFKVEGVLEQYLLHQSSRVYMDVVLLALIFHRA